MILDVEFIEDVQDFDVEFGENIENTTELEAQIEVLKQEKQQLIDEVTALNEEIAENQEQIEEKERRIAKLETQIEILNAQIAELQQDVTEAYEAGRKSQYDEFWDEVQQNGNRRNYNSLFTNVASIWTPKTFKPKYDIICEGDARQCFYAWEIANFPENVDLAALFKQQGIILDTSKATNLNLFFAYGYNFIGGLPTISCVNAGANTISLFRSVKVSKIEKVIVSEQTVYDYWFQYCSNLEEIRFEGVIGQNGLNLQWSTKLSKASWINIVGCYSTTISGLSMTGSLASVNSAFETSEGANDGSTSAEWLNLIATRPNVSFNLV